MFDALLKSKFYSKCKSEIKLTMKRIEIIRRKRNAMQKFLRNDVAVLLKNGLHSNAYDRVEQLYTDQKLSWCYEFIEQHSCVIILTQLSAMNKQRECPEECKEAISTLMFAAARFADLPELRELRALFAERYGNYLEPYVNQEFVKNLKVDPPTKQIKLQMMQEIALEYGINWDSKALEQQLYKPPQFAQVNSLSYKSRLEVEKKDQEKQKNSTVVNDLHYKSRAEIETQKEEKHEHGRGSPYWSSSTSLSSDSPTSADDSASEGRKLTKTELTNKSDNLENDVPPEGRKFDGLRSMGPPYIIPDSSKKPVGSNVNIDSLKTDKETEDVSKPVTRSMRNRTPLKQTAGSSHGNNDVTKTRSKSSTGENSFGDYDCRDEEEKKMDKLLLHYSRRPSHIPAPKRTGSLPSESVAAGVAVDDRKGLTRVATYHPDSGLGTQSHVHPKLPDYDDFVARLAAFRASS